LFCYNEISGVFAYIDSVLYQWINSLEFESKEQDKRRLLHSKVISEIKILREVILQLQLITNIL